MMDVGDAAGDRVFDRDHREIRRAWSAWIAANGVRKRLPAHE
jgi:hypothetical protein